MWGKKRGGTHCGGIPSAKTMKGVFRNKTPKGKKRGKGQEKVV